MSLESYPQYAIRETERITLGDAGIPALLARPQREGPCPAVLIQHGYGSSKEDVLPVVLALASFGFITLAPDAWAHGERLRPDEPNWMTASSADYFLMVVRHTISDMRQALATLAALPGARTDALVAAGFSMGAMAALVLGTEDDRVSGVVSVAGSPLPDLLPVRLFGADPPSADSQTWARAHDAAAHVERLAPRPLLLQHGRADDMVPVGGTLRLYEAAKPYYAGHADDLSLKLYDITHEITPPEASDAIEWLLRHFAAPAEPHIADQAAS